VKLFKVLFSVLVIGAVVLGVMEYKKLKENPESPEHPCSWYKPKALGNRLIENFYLTASSMSNLEELNQRCECDKLISNGKFRKFYKNLAWERKDHLIAYNSSAESAWNQIDENGNEKANYLEFWQTMRPVVKDFYQKNIKSIKIEYPIVHFRCSDAPLVRNPDMHLVKVASVKWMADKIKERGYSKVIMLSCNGFRRIGKESQKACDSYTEFYVETLKSYGIEVEVQCNDTFKDLALMIYSPLLVSLNASSFAFIAGVSKDPQNYIACNMGSERNGQYSMQTAADWILDHNAPLLHKDVKDYYDTDSVIKQLQE
jgi:hypothetical protein